MRTLASGRGIGKNVIGPYCMGELYIMIGPVIAENQLMFSHRVMADKCIGPTYMHNGVHSHESNGEAAR